MKKDSKTVLTVKEARGPTVAHVIDRVLDKGMVIEYRVESVSLSGIQLPVTVDARYVVASLDTYLERGATQEGGTVCGFGWLHELMTA